jgi:amino-acid N-acetyltransferase
VTADISICPARPADFRTSCELLAATSLPTEDLTTDHFERFLVASTTSGIVGLIGLESFGETGLLRSLVVDGSCRGLGLGHQLVDELEAIATAQGIAEIWLLTIDADRFFAQLGFTVSDRNAVPDAIANTPEFMSLCPGDAVLMRKSIGVCAGES